MDQHWLDESESLLKRLDRIEKFQAKYGVFPHKEARTTLAGLQKLAGEIPDVQHPASVDDVFQAELRGRMVGEAGALEQRFSGRNFDYDMILDMLAVPRSDVASLLLWLEPNRDNALEAADRLFHSSDCQEYELSPSFDIPSVSRQADEVAAVHVQRYHKRLGRLVQDLTKVGEFLRDISAVPTRQDRSYFNPIINTLAIGIPAICYTTEDGSVHVRERVLITLYGHEGMGHAVNQVLTKTASLPYFLKKDTNMTIATMESVAQFYQEVLFEDLLRSPQTQRDLGIEHKFAEIYREAQDTRLLEKYNSRLTRYAITVLADKSLGDPSSPAVIEEKARRIAKVALEPGTPRYWVENNRQKFDSQGNLEPGLVAELRYAAQPVKRALEEFSKLGMEYGGESRSVIDAVLLTGFWTPIGFVQNARVKAEAQARLNCH